MKNNRLTLVWETYKNYVCDIVACNPNAELKDILYWRNEIFCKMLIYIAPMSIIALVPSVFMAIRNGLYVIAVADLVAFSLMLFVMTVPKLPLGARKLIFICIFYALAAILLYYHGSVSAGMLFLLTLTILTAIIYSPRAAFYSAFANTVIAIVIGVLIFGKVNMPMAIDYNLGSWIAVSSNLILLSFICAQCLNLLLEGLSATIAGKIVVEKELKRVADRLLLATDSAGIGIWEWDIQKNVLTWDKGMFELYQLGDHKSVAVYQQWLSRLHPEDSERVNGDIEAAVTGAKDYDTEFRIIWADSSVHYIKASGVVERGGAGLALRMIGANLDITVGKNLEHEIKELNTNLEKRIEARTRELTNANASLEAFSYSVSHDLQAPVRAVSGFVEIIQTDYGHRMAEEEKKLFTFIKEAAINMTAIIKALMKLARFGKEELIISAVDMGQLIKRVWANNERDTPNHAVLSLPELPIVRADRLMIERVIVNLLSNAIKYSSKQEHPVVSVWCKQTDAEVTFYFKDNGVGFDMKNYERLFGAFQRLHRRSDFEGTGIGLMLSKSIIERHGGTIGAESAVNEGATFYFSLPVLETAA